jgi:septum formation protein
MPSLSSNPLRLVLASTSPRRRELLQAAGFSFTLRTGSVPEIRAADEPPANYVRRLAQEKAMSVEVASDEVILGADTTVAIDDHVLEKPADAADARRMLKLLSGRTHQVITGVCLRTESESHVRSETTLVRFCTIDDSEMEHYIASGHPMDKAGAYGIQGYPSRWAERIEGCYFNIVGLPVATVAKELCRLGL